jgi:hypothetical protein
MKLLAVYKVLPAIVFRGSWFASIPFYKNSTGVTFGNVVIIDSTLDKADYNSVLTHELVHVEQFYRYIGLNGLLYLTRYGRLKLEIEAYTRQYGEDDKMDNAIAYTLKRNYRLGDITVEYILQRIKQRRVSYAQT